MGDLRSRTRTFVVVSTLLVLLLVAGAAAVVARSVNTFAAHTANQRARTSTGLLVVVGSKFPKLTAADFAHGLNRNEGLALDEAVARGQRAGVLATLTMWDRSGRIVYSPAAQTEGTRPPMQEEIRAALAGRTITRRHPRELDPSTGRFTGVLDAFHALRDEQGQVFGVVEASLPLMPITQDAARIQHRIVAILVGGAVVLWLLLFPLTMRVARGVAAQWDPGRRRTLRAFADALDRGDVELAYQPQIEPRRGTVVAMEALVRWRRDGRLLSPDAFLPCVESSPLMARLTDRVLALALAQVAEWRRDGHDLRVSVNLSANDLAGDSLSTHVASALRRHGVDGAHLTLEITETALLADAEGARRVLAELVALGVDVAVDDFGTGHASISRLHDLPIAEVKVDQMFVRDATPRTRSYLVAIVGFAQAVGLRVVAEGVEDEATLGLLADLGCDLAQGYKVAHPMGAAEARRWLADRATATALAAALSADAAAPAA